MAEVTDASMREMLSKSKAYSVDQIRAVIDDDPGVTTNLFTDEVHPCRGFPGDALAA